MYRFTVGSLSGGGGVLQFLQTDVAELTGDFGRLQIFALNAPELFRCAYFYMCVHFDLRTFASLLNFPIQYVMLYFSR
jgi:hypothetical protein